MQLVTCAVPLLQHYVRALQQLPRGSVRCPVGVSRWDGHLELFPAAPGSALTHILLLDWSDTLALPPVLPPDCVGLLFLGQGPQRGRARGVVQLAAHAALPLDGLRLVGPGLPTMRLRQAAPAAPLAWLAAEQDTTLMRWSRTIGALGADVWARLVCLRYALIGLGRSGSRLALELAQQGVHQLTLIDPDHLELHNTGEMLGVRTTDLGRSKVEAVAAAITTLVPTPPDIVPIAASITRLQALHAAQACDVLVTCVDHDSARLAASAIATVFCKPLLDIAMGVHGHGPTRQMGADVRLMLPGRCVLCFGGLRDTVAARQVLASAEAERTFAAQRDWRQERAGSLASLNQCAVGITQRLLEDFIAARVQESTWIHLEFDQAGRLTVTYPSVPPAPDQPPCPLCQLLGWGEEGIPRVVAFLNQETGEPTTVHTADTTQRVTRATPGILAGAPQLQMTPSSSRPRRAV